MPVHAHNAGLFISRGRGAHAERIIDTFELIFVRQGVLAMHENGQEFTVKAGQTLYLWPGQKHGGIAPYSEDLKFYWVHFSLLETSDAACYEVPQIATASRPDYLTTLFRMFLENQESGPHSSVQADLLMMMLLSEVAHFSKHQDGSIAQSKLKLVARAESYIKLNMDKPISTSEIARALDINADYLGRVFHSVKGKTITETIHSMRVKSAKTLLMETDDTIDRISTECGFDNPGYFRRIFRRNEGMSPVKYRQLYCRVYINTE